MEKALFIFLGIVGLLTTICTSQAGLGWSFDECVQHYGQPTRPNSRMDDGEVMCHFSAKGYEINAYFISDTVSRIGYTADTAFDTAHVRVFLQTNGPDTTWEGPYRDPSDGSYRWRGIKDGATAYRAALILIDNSSSLVIWTKESDDFTTTRHTQEASGL